MVKREHVVFNFYQCPKEKLEDMRLFYQVLVELPELIGMKRMIAPYIVAGTSAPGITGFVIIETSHISFHAFSDDCVLFIDVFSCQDFDREKVENYLAGVFLPEKIKSKEVTTD